MAKIDKTYHQLLRKIMADGFKYEDPNRKGINRIQIPSYQFKHDFKDGFPAVTTKKLYWKGIVGELLWFLRGDTNIKYLIDNNINIWNKDAYNEYLKQFNKKYYDYSKNKHSLDDFISLIGKKSPQQSLAPYKFGDLGRVYGAQWRKWSTEPSVLMSTKKKFGSLEHTYDGLQYNYMDQISNLIKGLKDNPMGTRHIVTAWNPAELDDMALPPCHWSFEILVEPISLQDRTSMTKTRYISSPPTEKELDKDNTPKYKFTLKWHQRSVDSFLGKM